MKNCLEAKIKVKGNLNGFMPAGIQISKRGSDFSLKLRNCSRLELGPRRFLLQKPVTAMDFAFKGVCGEDDDMEYEDRVAGAEVNNCISEKAAENIGIRRDEEETAGGVVQELSEEESSNLIGVERIFNKL